jgi:hypothetical protein
MAEPPDLDTLARRYLDLWQEQVAAMAADPELSELMGRLMQAMSIGPAGIMSLWANAATQGKDGARRPRSDSAATDGTASARPPSGNGSDDLAELRERLAALERRIARVETVERAGVASEPTRAGSTARARARRSRT